MKNASRAHIFFKKVRKIDEQIPDVRKQLHENYNTFKSNNEFPRIIIRKRHLLLQPNGQMKQR